MTELFNDNLHSSLISTKVASEVSGYNPDYITRLCREKKIKGTQVGKVWLVERESLDAFVTAQGIMKHVRAEKLRTARAKEYRKAKRPVLTAALAAKTIEKTARRTTRAVRQNVFSAPTYSPRLVALAVALIVVAGSAYASTDQRALVFISAIPDATMRLTFASGPHLEPASSFRATSQTQPTHVAVMAPSIPNARTASRGFSLFASNSVIAALASANDLMDEARVPFNQTDLAHTARTRINRASIIAHDPLGSAIAVYVGTGELAYDASFSISNAYLSSVQHAGNSALASAAHARDGIAVLPRISGSIVDTYTRGVYAFTDASPKLADTSVLALYDLGDVISSKTASLSALPVAKQQEVAYNAAATVRSISARPQTADLAIAPSSVQASVASAAPASGMQLPLAHAYAAATNAEGALIALPLKAEDTMLGIAGYASTFIDAKQQPSDMLASAASPSWFTPITDMLDRTGRFTHALFASAVRALALLFPGGNIAAPALTVLSTEPAQTIAMPVPAPTITVSNTVSNATGGAYVDKRTVIQNFITSYPGSFSPTSFVGSAFDDAVMAVTRPFVQESVDRAIRSVHPGVDSNGATLTNVTINGGNATLSLLTAASTTLATTTITADLNVRGAVTAGTLNVGSLSSFGGIVAPYLNATDTNATSTFTNLTADTAALASANVNTLTLGSTSLTSFLGLGLSNIGGALTVATSSFSGPGSLFNADLLDGLDSTYILANAFSTSSADVWITSKSTDALPEGTSNLYYTDARARNAISATGVLTYASSTGVFSIAQSNGTTDGYLSAIDWTSFNNKISSTSLSALYPLTYNSSSGIFGLAFGTSTSNTWGGTQIFTNAPVLGSLTGFIKASAGALTTSLIDLSTDVSSTLPVSHGGTGSTSLTGLLKGNGTGPLLTATPGVDYAPATSGGSILYGNGAGGFSSVSISSPLTFTSGALGIQQANGSQNGYLTSSDWTTFNNKQVALTGTTGQFPYFSGTNTVTATSSIFLATNGNVGIGTTSPSATLSITGNSLLGGNLIVTGTATIGTLNGLVKGTNGVLSAAIDGTDYLSPATIGASFYTYFHATTTDALAEGTSHLYYTDARARNAISSSASGLSYNNLTGALSLTNGYVIPLSASTTEWSSFYATPSTRITAGTNLSWAGNTLNGPTDSYIHALFSAASPIAYNSSTGAFSISTSTLYTGTAGQVAYFNGTNTLTGTSNIFISGSNIGIGTITPVEKLQVSGAVQIDGRSATTTNKNERQVLLTQGGNELLVQQTSYWNGSSYTPTTGYGFGYQALLNNSSVNDNGFGYQALANNRGAYSNGFGYQALLNNTGFAATGFGNNTLYNNTGDNSSGLGYNALFGNTGSNATGVGYQALDINHGSFANGFGSNALYNNTGSFSNGFGYQALYNNTGVSANGFGDNALYNNSGSNAAGFGSQALYNNTGAYASGFGYQTLYKNQGDYAVAMGYQAGFNGTYPITGNYNTFLGSNSTYDTTNGTSTITNATAVGANIKLTTSNTVILGNAANVGIGTTSPFAKLSVAGNAYVGGALTATGTISFTGLGTGLVKSTAGTLTNATDGTDYLSPTAFDARLTATTSLSHLTTLAGLSTVGTITSGTWHGGVIGQAYGGTGLSSYSPGDILYADNTGTLMQLPHGASGQVLKVQAGLPAWGVDETIGSSGNDGIFATSTGLIYPLDTSNTLLVGTNATSTSNSILEVNGQAYISSKLGIGTSSPSAQLSVTGSGYFSGTLTASSIVDMGLSTNALVYVNGSNQLATTTISGPLSFSSGTLSISQANTSTSGYLSSTDWTTFNAKQDALTFAYPLINTGNTISTAFATSSATLGLGLSGALTTLGSSDSLTIATSSLFSGTTGQFPYFSGTNTLTATSSIFLDTTGNVGIGTTSPSQLLSVAGNAYIRGGLGVGEANAVANSIDVSQYGSYMQAGKVILYASTTNGSTQVGVNAGFSLLAAGLNNTAIGYQALFTATSSDYNTAIGYQALYNNTGNSNVANGYRALFYNTTGADNTALGFQALYMNSTGNYNTGIGYGALNANTTGTENVALGFDAMESNLTGNANVALGWEAMFHSTSTSNNIAIGFQALSGNTGGNNNVAIGLDTLLNNVTGGNNTAIGFQSLFNNTTGSNNTAIGYQALFFNATATSNTGIGFGAGSGSSAFSNQGGTYVGYQAGTSVSTGSDYNTLVGYNSGFGVTTGARNVLIGQSTIAASYNQVTTGSNNIAIGNDVAVPSATASNQLVIGNLIYGTGLDGTGATVSTGNIGIGTTSPSQTLSVAGNAYITGTATIGTLNGLVKGTNGVLSVATAGTDYQTPLVAGTDYAPATSGTALLYGNGAGGFSNASVSSPLTFTGGTLGIQAANASQPGYLTSSDWTTFNNKQVALTGTTGQFPYFSGTNTVTATSSIFLATNGNVGIGTTVPNGKLAVFSTLTDTAASAVFGANVTNTIAPTATSATEFRSLNMSNTITSSQQLSTLDAGYFENRLTGTGSISTANGLISNGLVLPAAAQNFGTVNEAVSVMAYPVNSFSNTVTGNVITARGLRVANSSNTGYTLTNQVGVSIDPLTTGTNNTALLIGGSGVPTGNYGIYNQSPNNNYFAGNVGIGTTSPYARLTTAVSAAATTTIAEFSNSTLSGSGNPIEIKLGNSTGLGASGGYASIQAGRFTTNDRGLRLIGRGQNESSAPTSIYLNGNGGTIAFNTNVSGSDGIERVRIDNSGNFGIGTTSPSQLLSVAGNAYITGTATIGTLNGLIKGTNGVLSAAAAGTDYAPATTGTALLYGNGAGGFSNASVSSPLTFTGGTLGIQAANTSQPGYLTSTDWNTFNGKQDALSFSYPLVNSANTISLAFGTTTANSWSQLQTFTNGFVSQASSTILGDLNITGIYNINSVPVAYLPDQTAFGGTVIYGNGGGYLSHVTGSDGQGNTGVGINAFHFLSTGSFNTAIGNAALYNTTVGTDNVANGVAALYSNTSGIQNTAIGNYSLFSNTTGGNNSAFGYQAGEYIANGTTGNTTSSNSLYLGFGTKALANGDTNEIVLGYNAVGLGSNSAVLGNDSITKTILKGNVGINTTVPGTNLSVVQSTAGVAGLTIATPASAAGYASGASLQFNYSGATAQTTRIARIVGVTEPSGGGDLFFDNAASAAGAWNTNMVILRGGNVGIGTTSPSQLLSVAGNAYITGTATIGTLNGLIKGTNGVLSAAAAGTDYAPATSGTALLYGNGAGGFSNASVSSPLTFTGGTLGIQAANASQPGYLTSTDWNTFNGKQDALSFSYPLVNSANTISLAFGTTTANSWSQTQTFTKAGTTLGAATVFQAGSNVIAAQFGSGSTAGFTADQYGSAVRFNGLGVQWGDLSYYPTGGGNGNQGNFRLSVAGGVLNTTPNAKLGVGDLYVNGNVGIGTTTPSALLTVSGSQAGISIDRTGNDSYLQLSSSGVVAGQLRYFAPNVLSIADLNGTDKVVFDTSLGYVGIGTTSPQTLLGLQGGIGVSSSQLYLGANGNTALGANSVSSSARLSITPSGTDALFINNSSGALRTDFGFDGGGNYQERMRNAAGVITTNITTNAGTPTYFNAGNVGIGTTSPLGKLHIATSGSGAAAVSSAGDELVLESGGTTGATILGGTASDLGLYFGDSVSQTMGRIVYANSTDSLQLWTNATQRLTINSSGNVGIGTTTPDAELTVVTAGPSARTWLAGAGTVAIFDRVGTGSSGAAYLDLVTGTTGVDAIRFGNTTNEANGELEYNYATNAMNFYTNGSARATIDASGNLAIGTTSPLTRLDVVGTNGLPINTGLTSAALLVRDSTTNYRLGLGTYSSGAYIQSANTGTAYGSLSLNPNGGNVGIGTTTPSNTLSISTKSTGNGITFDSNGTIIGSLAQNTVGQAVGLALEGVPGRQITINGTSNSNVLIANGGGNVGIGTTTPQSRLHIEGTNSVSGGLSIYSTAGTANGRLAIYPIGNTSTAIQKLSSNGVLSFLNSAGGSELTIDNAGNVGIGTTSPAAQLSLSKSTGGDRMFEMYDTFSSPTTYDALLYRANNIPAGTGATTANALLRLVDSSSNYPLSIETTAGASLLDVMGNGNVGIGTSTPSAKLMVMGNGTNPAVRIDGSAGTALQLDYFSHGGSFYSSYYATLGQYGGAGGVGTIGGLQIVNQSPVLNSSQDIVFANQLGTSAAIARMIIDGYGNVGIGAATSSITARLTVQGADTSAATHALEVTNSASTTLFMVNDAGNVGIGTTSPSAPLSVSGNAYITGTTTMDSQLVLPVGTQTSLSLAFEGNQTTGIFGNGTGLSVVRSGSLMAQFGPSNVWFNNAVTSLASASGFNINSTSGTNAPVYTFRNDTTTGVGHGANANELAFFTNNINRVLINAAGNVGIGTTSPGSTLSVAGNSYVSGFYNTSGTTGGYQIDGNTVLQASSSNFSTFLGVNAGASVQSSASSNTALGSGALFSNQTGSYNTASGQGALSSNVSGSFNVANGSGALFYTTTSNNVAVGYNTLGTNTTGAASTGVGESALYYNTSANSSVAVGSKAAMGTASYSNQGITALGYQAGASLQTGSDYNTLVGYNSGFGVTTGARNVLIGQSTIAASYNQVTTGSNNIAIGNDVAVPSATASNQLVIGNLIYGTGLDGTGATVSTGNIGVGTTTPWRTLAVSGTAAINGLTSTGGTLTLCINNTTKEIVTSSAACTTSDERLKTNIQSLDGSAGLEAIEALHPVSFDYKDSSFGTGPQLGFLAQEVAKIFPEFVSTSTPTAYTPDVTYTLNYQGLITPTIKALQELAQGYSLSNPGVASSTIASSYAGSGSAAITVDSQGNVTMGKALTASSITAGTLSIAQSFSAGAVTAQSVTAGGTVSANRYVVPQQASVFAFGSSTVSMQVPPEALASGGSVDLYQLAGYATAGVEALAARTDLLSVKIDDLATRVSALEALHAATTTASTTDTQSSSGFLATLENALSGLGIIIHQGYLALDSLVTHQLFLVKGSDGTSSTGSEVIPSGATHLTVMNPLVHTSSQIFLTFTSSVDGSWYLSQKQEGSFTITLSKAQAQDTEFDYFIIQTDPNAQMAAAGQAAQPAGATEAPSTPAPVSVNGGPMVTLNGDPAVQLPQGAAWTDPGATAKAADGTDLTSSITVAGSVDTNTAGLYTITYNVVDAAGLGGQASRVVTVLAPTSAPSDGTTVTQAPASTSSTDTGTTGTSAASTDSSASSGTTATASTNTTSAPAPTASTDTTSAPADSTASSGTVSAAPATSPTPAS